MSKIILTKKIIVSNIINIRNRPDKERIMTSTENIWETARKIGLCKQQVMIFIKMLERIPLMFWGPEEEQRKHMETMKKIFETVSDNKYSITVLGGMIGSNDTYFELKKIEK